MMKTNPILVAALVVATLPAAALADRPQTPVAAEFDGTQMESRERTPFAWRVVRFPGRVVNTVVRAPLIVGETALGQRRIISRDGFFAADEDERRALTLRRVPFAGDVPDND